MTDAKPFEPPRFCDVPPCGGRIGPDSAHFIVEEIPAYPLSGEGEHLFLWIEKEGHNTQDVAKKIAHAAQMKEREVGYAGMKDKNAITRQWFSLATKAADADSWELGPGLSILAVSRHQNKLRTGHLIGNRFTITLVDVPDSGTNHAQEIAAILQQRGLPNYFGPQRFGHEGRNLAQALAWVKKGLSTSSGAPSEPDRRRRKPKRRFENKLLPSVLQSEVFNRYVSARLARNEELLRGEIVRLDGTGKSFAVLDLESELPRYRARDLHLTGPMIGPKGLQAEDEARALEDAVCAEFGLDEGHLAFLAAHAPGTRRDLMLSPEGLEVRSEQPGELVLSFTLPAGAYATQVVREFTGSGYFSHRDEASRKPTVT